MAQPAFWPTKTPFFPIGNTSPICLTQCMPPEQDIDILLLGCGDPRNILYTLYANSGDQLSDARKFDITCCDIEPAILARNILVYTLITDDEYPNNATQIWNIHYHYFLDDATYALLIAQCRKLVLLSGSLEMWNTCEYSSFLRVSSRLTLSELNRLWTLYAATHSFSTTRMQQFKQAFVHGLKSTPLTGSNITAAQSAGPFLTRAVVMSGEACQHFWKTGVTFEDQDDISRATIVNPTFAYASQGEGFVAHYGTFPLPAFHLAPAFASLQTSSPGRASPTIFDLFRLAQSQFSAWCEAARLRFKESSASLVLRFVVGDVLTTCHALTDYAINSGSISHERVHPWDASLLILDGDYDAVTSHPAPHEFDVIDTSNLSNNIGVVNILLAASPLLSRRPSSILLTEILLKTEDDPFKSFVTQLCGDPNTLFTLLDLVPCGYVSGFVSQSNVHEAVDFGFMGKESRERIGHHERIVWKILSLIDADLDEPNQLISLAFDNSQLTDILHDIYHRMFWREADANTLKAKLSSFANLLDMGSVHYCRRSFALLVRLVARRVAADWNQVLDNLFSRIRESSQFSVSMNYYQDLQCQFYTLGLHTDSSCSPTNPALSINKAFGPFRSWLNVPPVVCVILVVPREKLAIFDDMDRPTMNAPLNVRVSSDLLCSFFASFQITFGTVSISGEQDEARAVITQDPKGKHGTSPFVVACWVPTWLLCIDLEATFISLGVVVTPFTVELTSEIGMDMQLYEAALMDSSQVHIVSTAPLAHSDIDIGPPSTVRNEQPHIPLLSSNLTVTADQSCQSLVSVAYRIDLQEKEVSGVLADPKTPIQIVCKDHFGVDLTIGDHFKQHIRFPAIVNVAAAKLRVARKSSWVVAPVPRSGRFKFSTLSLSMRKNAASTWNIHYVNLERLPALRMTVANKPEWLDAHGTLAFSDREREQMTTKRETLPLTQFKCCVHTMLMDFSGVKVEKRSDVIALNRASDGGIDTVFFATHLRLDLPNHTVVLEAFVLTIEHKILDTLLPALSRLSNRVAIVVNKEELVVWKRLLPAVAERCRTWKHKANCAHLQHGGTPLSIEHGGNPICDCGRGIVTERFKAIREWAPFAPYVTRVAISPLFSLSYLDSVGQLEMMDKLMKEMASIRAEGSRSQEPQCQKCGRTPGDEKLSLCGGCKIVSYCSRECQLADRRRHKPACKT